MFGPYRIACEDCEFQTEVPRGESARTAAEAHSGRSGHVARITELGTGAETTVGD